MHTLPQLVCPVSHPRIRPLLLSRCYDLQISPVRPNMYYILTLKTETNGWWGFDPWKLSPWRWHVISPQFRNIFHVFHVGSSQSVSDQKQNSFELSLAVKQKRAGHDCSVQEALKDSHRGTASVNACRFQSSVYQVKSIFRSLIFTRE